MDTGQKWSDLPVEERLARKFSMEQSEQKRVEVALPEVVVPGHEVQKNLLPKQPREIWELLESKGREVAARHSQTRVRGTEFKSGPRKGEMRPDKVVDHYAIVTPDAANCPLIHAVWHDGKLDMVQTCLHYTDSINNITELKKFIRESHATQA
jgi:hypothetical protein